MIGRSGEPHYGIHSPPAPWDAPEACDQCDCIDDECCAHGCHLTATDYRGMAAEARYDADREEA